MTTLPVPLVAFGGGGGMDEPLRQLAGLVHADAAVASIGVLVDEVDLAVPDGDGVAGGHRSPSLSSGSRRPGVAPFSPSESILAIGAKGSGDGENGRSVAPMEPGSSHSQRAPGPNPSRLVVAPMACRARSSVRSATPASRASAFTFLAGTG